MTLRIPQFVWPHESKKQPSPKPRQDKNDFYYKPHNFWEIVINIHDRQRLNQIIDILEKKNHWAFVYTEKNLKRNFYVLFGYIMFPFPENTDWFETNLGIHGTYTKTNEHPNKYMKRALHAIVNPEPNYQYVVRINKGWYKAGAGPYLSDRIDPYDCDDHYYTNKDGIFDHHI
jgi:hypothetical protein